MAHRHNVHERSCGSTSPGWVVYMMPTEGMVVRTCEAVLPRLTEANEILQSTYNGLTKSVTLLQAGWNSQPAWD